ncbi:MAG: GMP synthase [Acidimicrobiia bacterium]
MVCDHVPEELSHVAGDYPDMFRALFAEEEVELASYDVVNGELPTHPRESEAWIITGSRYSVNDDLAWIRDLEEFTSRVPAARVPLVGVCFGHQLIARALGGSVVRSKRGWGVGCMEVEVRSEASGPAWMEPARDRYRILNSHADQVVSLPEGTRLLASTDHCPVSLMTVGDYLLGIQGHPEMDPSYLKALVESRRGRSIPEETAARALESLKLGSDSTVVRDWMLNFMTQET